MLLILYNIWKIFKKEGVEMLQYKIDVIDTLKENGYNSTRILKEGTISQAAMQKIRKNEMVGIKTLEKLCEILDMQPGNIIKYTENK
jgi:DNA-binding Xre family transcriptional regulator